MRWKVSFCQRYSKKRLLEQEKTMLEGGIILSVGCKKYLIDLYMNEIYGNRYVKL